ncbi:MAG: efflux RND transporter permease subunit [Planctomycetota bacterium]
MSQLSRIEKAARRPAWRQGSIAWMASNSVAANLLMAVLILGGILFASRMKQEVFPEFATDRIAISVPYPGASPAEVETGILLAIEDAVQGIDGVKEVTSNANEGAGNVSVEILTSADAAKVQQDVKNAVDRIQSFPLEAERPVVSLVELRNQVCSLILSGDVERGVLRDLAERIRDELLARPDITLVEIANARPLEVAVEIPRADLRRYGLTLDAVAARIRESALELPGGGIRSPSGEKLLRVQERRDAAEEYADIPIVAGIDGSMVRLGDLADIRDTFRETDQEATFDGRPAIKVDVFRVGDQTPQSVSDSVYAFLAEAGPSLPEGVSVAVWDDRSEQYRDRVQLLLRNAAMGLGLVLLLLGLFLEPRLAFWVTMGIVASVIGSFLVIPFTGASINMISLFAFIVTLGIIVDDAIVVGENIYEKRNEGVGYLRAAIEGAREISGPVVFAVLTNIAAFIPLLFVPGASGKFFFQIPAIVIAVFVVSLVESLYILPAHLAHKPADNLFWRALDWPRRVFTAVLDVFILKIFPHFVRFVIRFRFITIGLAFATLILAVASVPAGLVKFSFLPRIDGDIVRVQVTLPFGAPIERTREVQQRLVDAALATVEENGGRRILRGIYTQIGSTIDLGSPGAIPSTESGAHILSIQLQLVPSEQRDVSGVRFSERWRELTGNISGLETITFTAEIGRSTGAPIDVQLSHRDRATLDRAAEDLADAVAAYSGTKDIDDGVQQGKPQKSFTVRPEGFALGLTAESVARQVRGSFFGSEALRQQRGRNEVRVMVRLPERERETLETVEELVLRTPSGGEIRLEEAVDVEDGYSYTQIRRRDGRRVVAVTADVESTTGGPNATEIVADLKAKDLPRLIARHPGLSWTIEGEQKSQGESLAAIGVGAVFALLAIFAMLAIPFRSYVQPIIVMLAIPFGAIGAVLGHVLLGYELSIISMFGLIALAGVVVNDSMVLVVTANQFRDDGLPVREAVLRASVRRFRPIILTSLTTFFGLAPMIFETSVQARFLIPMAVSLGFGILFATIIILLLVPAIYVALDDLARLLSWIFPDLHPDRVRAQRIEDDADAVPGGP